MKSLYFIFFIFVVILLTSCNSVEVFRLDSVQNVQQIPEEEPAVSEKVQINNTIVSTTVSNIVPIEDIMQELPVQPVTELSIPSSTRFIVAVADDSPVSDVILSSEVTNAALSKQDSSKYSGKTSSAIFKELRQDDFNDKITLLISHGNAIIVDGGSDDALVDALEDSLDSYSVDFDVVSSDDVNASDLKSLFE